MLKKLSASFLVLVALFATAVLPVVAQSQNSKDVPCAVLFDTQGNQTQLVLTIGSEWNSLSVTSDVSFDELLGFLSDNYIVFPQGNATLAGLQQSYDQQLMLCIAVSPVGNDLTVVNEIPRDYFRQFSGGVPIEEYIKTAGFPMLTANGRPVAITGNSVAGSGVTTLEAIYLVSSDPAQDFFDVLQLSMDQNWKQASLATGLTRTLASLRVATEAGVEPLDIEFQKAIAAHFGLQIESLTPVVQPTTGPLFGGTPSPSVPVIAPTSGPLFGEPVGTQTVSPEATAVATQDLGSDTGMGADMTQEPEATVEATPAPEFAPPGSLGGATH